MTSQKSSPRSNNRRAFSPFLYSFYRALAENFIFPLLNAFGIALFTIILPFAEAIPNIQLVASEEGKMLKELYRYVILPDAEVVSYFLMLAVCLFSSLTGVFLFRFMAAKKTVNVYYSLGIKRRSLFLAKYAAGAIMLAVSVAVPLLVSAVVNTHYFGASAELWTAAIYYMLSLYLLAMLCMTVTAAVFSTVGTVLEGIGFSAVILLLPTILIYCLQFLMSTLLWGSPYGSRHIHFGDYQEFDRSFVQELTQYNPIFFLQRGLEKLAMPKTGETIAKGDIATAFAELLPWLAVCAVCLGIALLVFQRRKTEISGFIGKNKILNFAVELILGFGASTVVLYFLYSRINHMLAFALALLPYAVIYLVIEAILTRSAKDLLKGLWKLPVHLVIPIAVYAVFTTGLFGYTGSIPVTEDIRAVYVDADYPLDGYGEKYWSGSNNFDSFAISTDNMNLAGALTTDRDIEFARQLHQMMIDAKDAEQTIDKPLCIVYVLNDGSEIRRYYPYTTVDALKKSLLLYETDWSRETLTEVISSNPTQQQLADDDANPGVEHPYRYTAYGYETGTVFLADAITGEHIPLTLTPEQHTALKQALIADVTAQTAQQKFYPDQPNRYFLRFYDGADAQFELGEYETGTYNGPWTFPLTESTRDTQAFLRENGMLPEAENAISETAEITISPITRVYEEADTHLYSSSGDDHSSRLFAAAFRQLFPDETYQPFEDSVPLTWAQFSAIRDHLYPYYYTENSGYCIELRAGSSMHSLFLPEQYATPEIQALFDA